MVVVCVWCAACVVRTRHQRRCVFHTAAAVHLIDVAEHLGVRLAEYPPSRALDNQQLLATGVSHLRLDVRVDGVRKMPHFSSKKGAKLHSSQSETVPTSPYLHTNAYSSMAMNTPALNHVAKRNPYHSRISAQTRASCRQ